MNVFEVEYKSYGTEDRSTTSIGLFSTPENAMDTIDFLIRRHHGTLDGNASEFSKEFSAVWVDYKNPNSIARARVYNVMIRSVD